VVGFSVVFDGKCISDDLGIAEPGVKRVSADMSSAASLRCFLNALYLCDKVLNFVFAGPTLDGAFATDGRKMFVVEVVAVVAVLPRFRDQSTLHVHSDHHYRTNKHRNGCHTFRFRLSRTTYHSSSWSCTR